MIAPSKKKRRSAALLIATTWAIAGHFHHRSGTTTTMPFCSAWTLDSTIHNNHRGSWQRNDNNHKRRQSFLFSTQTAPSNVSAEPAAATYRDLFPASDRITNGTLRVDSTHTLYYEIHGRGPLQALFLHGGPGAGCFPNHARFFDPEKYTVVLVDQRGSGKSTPKGCVYENTLDHLVEDCERLRRHLLSLLPPNATGNNGNGNRNGSSNQPWDVVLGGSWGATLGLAYAQKHPSSLRSLILRGICALRPSEIDWLFSADGGSSRRLPEAWKNFSLAVGTTGDSSSSSSSGRRDTLHKYYDCFFHKGTNGTVDNSVRLAATRSWMMWEMSATASAQSKHNQSNPLENTVLVSSPSSAGMWGFENHIGEPIAFDNRSPEMVAQELRKDIVQQPSEDFANGPRPVRPLDDSMPLFDSIRGAAANNNNTNNKTGGFRLPPDYVPAQAMLTCYYSVNDLYVMGNKNLLLEATNKNVKIIGIQGGKDPICPPDTALDLLQSQQASNNNMELRIPLESGHSMYDPAIKHELVQATDRLADGFLEQQ